MECGSEAAALECARETAVADATALHGAFGASIFKAARNNRTAKENSSQ